MFIYKCKNNKYKQNSEIRQSMKLKEIGKNRFKIVEKRRAVVA